MGLYESVKLENNDAMVCKISRIFWRQYDGYIDTVWHPRDYKIQVSVVATRGFLIIIELYMSRGGREGFQ